jgi:hypothetical protein
MGFAHEDGPPLGYRYGARNGRRSIQNTDAQDETDWFLAISVSDGLIYP